MEEWSQWESEISLLVINEEGKLEGQRTDFKRERALICLVFFLTGMPLYRGQ